MPRGCCEETALVEAVEFSPIAAKSRAPSSPHWARFDAIRGIVWCRHWWRRSQVQVSIIFLSASHFQRRSFVAVPALQLQVVVIGYGGAAECDLLLMSNPRNNLSSFRVVPSKPPHTTFWGTCNCPWNVTIRLEFHWFRLLYGKLYFTTNRTNGVWSQGTRVDVNDKVDFFFRPLHQTVVCPSVCLFHAGH